MAAGGAALEELAAELDRVAERLADAAMAVLRAALADEGFEEGEAAVRARATERLLNRARASVEKAARLTRQAAGGTMPFLGGAGADDW
jgi:hypothetical protein